MFENCSQIILKVTKDCNLRCKHCYVKNKDHYKGQTMSFEIFRKLIHRVILDQQRAVSPPKNIQIIFHGGEPTLLEKSKFQIFIDYAKKMLPSVNFGMVTNATLLDESWIKLLLKNNISPTISFDEGASREDELKQQGQSVLKKINLLRKHQLTFGIISIISSENYKKFPKTLRKLLPQAKSIRANYIENLSTSKFAENEIRGSELYSFIYKPVLEESLKKLDPPSELNLGIIINKFAESFLEKDTSKESKLNCYTKFCGGGNSIVEVEPTGEINFCGRWDTLRKISTMGHIDAPDPWGIFSLQTALNLQILKIKDIKKKKCDRCPAAVICDYGCIAFSYIKYAGKVQMRKEISCELFIELQKLLFKNRYQALILYAKQKKLLIQETKTLYIISLPRNLLIRKKFTDHKIHIFNEKLYLSKKHINSNYF